MKSIPRLTLLAAACLLSSCGKKEGSPPEEQKSAVSYTTPGAEWNEPDFTRWMSRAELQFLQKDTPHDQYFAHVEGRNNAGRLEYRAVVKPFAAEGYDQWAVFWGISEAELFNCELDLLGKGFFRSDMQVFPDQTGKALYQIVWLQPKGMAAKQTALAAVAPPAETPPPAQSPAAAEPVPQVPAPAPPELVQAEPVARPAPEPAEPEPKKEEPAAKPVKTATYVVQSNDTLGKIAKSRGVTVAEIRSVNHLKVDALKIGQKLLIPVKGR